MRDYRVEYRMYPNAEVDAIIVLAMTVEEAYDKAVYEAIPAREGGVPYSAWVQSVRYINGSFRVFNNFEGKPY